MYLCRYTKALDNEFIIVPVDESGFCSFFSGINQKPGPRDRYPFISNVFEARHAVGTWKLELGRQLVSLPNGTVLRCTCTNTHGEAKAVPARRTCLYRISMIVLLEVPS